jgi:hypothetical protein
LPDKFDVVAVVRVDELEEVVLQIVVNPHAVAIDRFLL